MQKRKRFGEGYLIRSGGEGVSQLSRSVGNEEGKETNLFTRILLAGQFHFAHTAGTDSLTQDPFSRGRRNGGSRPAVFGGGRAPGIGRAMRYGSRAGVVGDSSVGRHFRVGLDGSAMRFGAAVTLRT